MTREVTLVDAGLGNIASVERALLQVGSAVNITSDPDVVARARMLVFPGQSAFGTATQAVVDGAMGAAIKMAIGRGDPFLGICLGMQLLFNSSEENGGQQGLGVLPGTCKRFPLDMAVPAEAAAVESAMQAAEPQARDVAQTVAAPTVSAAPPQASVGSSAPPIETRPHAPTPDATPTGVTAELPSRAFEGGVGNASTQSEAPPPQPKAAPAERSPLMRRVKVPHMGWNEVEPTKDHYYFVHSYYVVADKSEDVMWMTTYGGIRFPAAVRRNNVLGCQFHPEKSQRDGLRFLRAFLLGGWG